IRACRAILAPTDILVADANTGWTMADAARVVNAVADLDVYIEQPCMSYAESISIRRRTTLPFVLDENIGSVGDLVQGIAEDAFDVINLKISKVGGLTKARQMRDLCVSSGIPMTIEDTWGGDIVTATIAHLARSTPQKFCFTATDFNSYVTVSIAGGAPKREDGFMTASDAPGLGITPKFDVLGQPVAVIAGEARAPSISSPATPRARWATSSWVASRRRRARRCGNNRASSPATSRSAISCSTSRAAVS